MNESNQWCLKQNTFSMLLIAMMIIVISMCWASRAIAAENAANDTPTANIIIPAGPLGKAVSNYAAQTGVRLTFDPTIAEGKITPGLKGHYSVNEGFEKLLNDSGLEAIDDQDGGYFLVPTEAALPVMGDNAIITDTVNVRAQRFYELGPLPGLGLTKEEIPGNVQSISAQEIKDSHSLSMTELFNTKLQGVTVNDYQGNPFQMDVQYRGFTAGPQIGTPQGLSVFLDGIRVNEPFGDVVNWDMIPMNAIANVDVFPGSNPIFGLNTLGGAFTMKTKDGFNHDKADVQILAGSFGRKQLQMENGWNNGKIAVFGAANLFMEDGWRDDSPSEVNQFFGKGSYRGDKIDVNLTTLLVQTDLVGNGLTPTEQYNQDPESVFTSPDTTTNKLQQFQLASAFQVNDKFSITGQVYRRNSDRHQVGSDVVTDWDDELIARRFPTDDEQYTCLFNSTNDYNLPDYYAVPIENYEPGVKDLFSFGNPSPAQDLVVFGELFTFNQAQFDAKYGQYKNTPLSADFVASYEFAFLQAKNIKELLTYNRNTPVIPVDGPTSTEYFGENTYSSGGVGATFVNPSSSGFPAIYGDAYFFETDNNNVITKYHIVLAPALNETECIQTRATFEGYGINAGDGTSNQLSIDGGQGGRGTQPGYVEGTPTAIITDNRITQNTDGASVQFNWNLDEHKFMVGVSIDAASADYKNSQRLGFFDANRKGYLDPEQAHPQFLAAFEPLENSNFSGTNTTKSIYFSETWNPVEAWNFNFSGRYNDTITKSKIATRYGAYGANYSVTDLIGEPDGVNVCPGGDCSGVSTNYRLYRLNDTLAESESESFSYYSFNPSLGATWQAKNNLNVYANWSQGTRVPSVIELGCASDHTPTGEYYQDGEGGFYEIPKSVLEKRTCYLPNTLSGDPYLPQIKATSYDIGVRGIIANTIEWNLGAYQTDLKDDIYFVAIGGGSGFFDTIGNTRRRGIEAGLSGQKGKWGFSVNYALTEATFENKFLMISPDNGTALYQKAIGNSIINVDKGDTMPGVSRHNLNGTVSYQVTQKWQVGVTAIAHSSSYVRGNENNEHEIGQVQYRTIRDAITGNDIQVGRRPMRNPGKVPGYATFNFQTTYKFTPNLNLTLLVNNIFDEEYFSAGGLGRNPFSPKINGAIGPAGYNHNSGDWESTNFVAPGAPRAAWLSLNWQFD